ncbi:PTS sugar transporter subunit IIA [Rothia sp. HC945]|uniref:BglG family transcription antiterminator n=1 Tax=Rothia sp. HC945 TaxID=3171170 RepID=UPI003F216394
MSARTRREEQLVGILARERHAVSASTLARALAVTERSVRNYVRSVNDRFGAELLVSSSEGIRLDRTLYDEVRRRSDGHLRISSAPEERLDTLMVALVRSASVDVFDLEEQLCVSVSTIEADVARARPLFAEYGLTLVREGDRIGIEGTERQKRRFLRSLLYNASESAGLEVMRGIRSEPDSAVARLHRLVMTGLEHYGHLPNQYVLGELMTHLSLVAERFGHDGTVGETGPARRDSAAGGPVADESAAEAVAESFRKVYGWALPPEELDVLRAYLDAGRDRDASSGAEEDEALSVVARTTVDHVCGLFGLGHPRDETLDALLVHIQSLGRRVRSGNQWLNPLGQGFKAAHPVVHEITLHLSQALESHLGAALSEGEIDYLSFHLGTAFQDNIDAGPRVTYTIVTPSYGRLSETTIDRIVRAASDDAVCDRTIMDLSHDVTAVPSDIIISSVPVPDAGDIPVVQVSPFVDAADASAIAGAIGQEKQRQRRHQVKESILRMLDADLFLEIGAETSPKAAIEVGSEALHRAGYVQGDYAEDVMDRERRSSTAFGNGFAIPHSLHTDALRSGVCILRPERSMMWHGEPVRLILLFAVAPDGLVVFRKVLDVLSQVLTDTERFEEFVDAAGSKADFVRALDRVVA